MDPEKRTARDLIADLARALPKARYAGFFPVVRLLERLLTGRSRIGSARSPDDELIRFRHDPGLSFSVGDISSAVIGKARAGVSEEATETGERDIVEITSTFLGLCGSVSPLPPYFSDEVAREDPFTRHRQSFFDLFHHRLIALFYRSAVRYDLPNEYESHAEDVWSRRLLALTGSSHDQAAGGAPSELPRWHLLGLVPLLATQVRGAHGLELGLTKVLEAELGDLDIHVTQFVGGWMKLGDPQRMCCGVYNCELGKSTVLGERVFDSSGRVQISIGTLSKQAYERFLPGADLFALTAKVVRLFSDELLEYQLELTLAEGTNRALRLSSKPISSLGRNTWLGQDAGQTRHYIESSASAA